MPDAPYTKEYAAFCVAYTNAIVAWNNAEESSRVILSSLSSRGSVGATIAIYQLGNASLVDAIRTVCRFFRSFDDELATQQSDHVEHFAEGLDRMRSYRNFYVHQTRGIGCDENGDYRALLFGLDVKGGYSFVRHNLTMADLEAFTGHCVALQDYGEAIAQSIAPNALTAQVTPAPTQIASLQKPLWPERLKRTRESLITPPPPPQS